MRKILGGSAVAAGVLAAGLLAGYWHFADLMPRRGSPEPVTSVGPGTGATTSPSSNPAAPRSSTAAPSAEQAAANPEPSVPLLQDAAIPPEAMAEESGEEGSGPPSFELLRVEPDGSAVVAGHAAPGSEIVLRNGDAVIARDTAGPSGAFAMTLETPLAVGEHQLQLETTGPDGDLVASAETAIVSVPPRGREEELLVAIEEPDAATRLLSVPAASRNAALDVAAPIVASVENNGEGVGSPAEPTLPAMAADEQSVDTASLAADSGGSSGPQNPTDTNDPALAIAAVEIEGDTIYIAGRAKPGTTVRLYLNDEFLAETNGSGSAAEFVAEARADVPVGPHVVRADTIGPDGSVLARVEVPFDRPDETDMAALAPPLGAAEQEDGSGEARMTADATASTQATDPAALDAPTAAAPLRGSTSSDISSQPGTADASVGAESFSPAVVRAGDAQELQTASPGQSGNETAASARTQAALEPVDGRVIIRRGDTLWRISRNAYGLGSRYTVIYLANGDQIRNPDLIYPGQVFRMPGDRRAEGRSASQ